MDDQVKTQDGKFVCVECQNENELDDKKEGDVVECGFCGIEYEVKEADDDGNVVLEIVEEEK